MALTKNQKILLGLLAVQAVAIFLFQGPLQGSTAPPEEHALFPGVAELEVGRVDVKGPEEDKSVTLVRDGDIWRIEEAGGYPADGAKVTKLIDSLADMQVRRPVVTSSRYHDALKVTADDHERDVRIYPAGKDDPAVELYLGTSPNYRATHIRRTDEDAVYEVSGLGAYDVRDTPAGWIDTKLLDIRAEDVTGMRVENAGGSFEVERMADGGWQLISDRQRVLDKAEVDSLVRAAASLSVAEPAGPIDRTAQGLDPAAATVTLKVKQPAPETAGEEDESPAGEPEVREVTVWVGSVAPDKDSQRYVAHSGFDYAARAWKGSLDKLVDATKKSLEPKKDTDDSAG
jgi:hypothetical protein